MTLIQWFSEPVTWWGLMYFSILNTILTALLKKPKGAE